MFILASQLKDHPIISLQNGQVVAVAGDLLIDSATLTVAAVYCHSGGWKKETNVLMMRDVRQVAREGLVIDSLEDIEDVAEIVRLKVIIESGFRLMGIAVINESGDHLGHVEDFTVHLESYKVQKLYLKQSLLKNLLLNNLVIDRSNILEVTNQHIVVRDATVPIPKIGISTAPTPD